MKRANEGVVVDFYNQINLLYGSITEFCSPTTCPEMKATDEYELPPSLWRLFVVVAGRGADRVGVV